MWMITPTEPLVPAMQDIQINAFAFAIYYTILCGLLVTRPRVPSKTLAMFAALRLSTFIGRCADFEPVGQVLTLSAHVNLLEALVAPVVDMAPSKVQHRIEAILGGCLAVALLGSFGHLFTQIGRSGTSYAGGLITSERMVQVYLGSLTLFLVVAAVSTISAFQKRNRHSSLILMLLLFLVAVPLLYLQVKAMFPGARIYLQTEQVLFSCWYLPEVLLLGLLWYAYQQDTWPTEAKEDGMNSKSLPFSVEAKTLPVALQKAVRYE